VKLRNEARQLKRKAISSIRAAMRAFNDSVDDGRVTAVLLNLQHSFEMLLKAALVQNKGRVFDPGTGRSIGFERCLHEARVDPQLKLGSEEAGALRAIDALRDDEQHWFTVVDEALLYLHTRAAVTLFDDLLHRAFGERLADHLPNRVLPVGTEPPQAFEILVDREYANIANLLRPGRRASAEARARLRGLLAMEAHVEPDTRVSDTDVRRVVAGVRAGKTREQVFPRLSHVGAAVTGSGVTVQVRFVKKGGLPVRFVGADAPIDASAIRVIDLNTKYHYRPRDLALAVGLTEPRAVALRAHLGVDGDDECRHVFEDFSGQPVHYSDNAFRQMRDALRDGIDMKAVWAAHRPARRGAHLFPCTQPGCAGAVSVAA
jgi:hypothetical protein